jgi:hypothetical protein
MPTAIAPVGAAPMPPTPINAPPAGQDLFQYLASVNPSGTPAAPSPGQLGGAMVENLRGFLDRSQGFSAKARELTARTPEAPATKMVHRGSGDQPVSPQALSMGPRPEKPPVDGNQLDKVIQSLGMMFDYSIETQMVVRGTTQVSGAANTLLRGQ